MNRVPLGCRHRLTESDLLFISATLAATAAAQESLERLFEDDPSLQSILDHPLLLKKILSSREVLEISPELYFYVLVRHCFMTAGIDDTGTTDYVAGTLADYAKENLLSWSTNGSPEGQLTYHVDFLNALDHADSYEKFYLHVLSGNQFLVLTGLFPQFLEERERRRGAPGVDYYESVASGSYRTAGEHPLADEFDVKRVYHRLSESFHETRVALNHLADEFLILAD